jgi:hypothetical protein
MNIKRFWFISRATVVIAAAPLIAAIAAQAGLAPYDLRCDYAVNPLGVDSAAPRLSWKLAGAASGLRQTAYEITASKSSPATPSGKTEWDSGKVESDETIQIPFHGAFDLNSWDQVVWKVRVWDEHGQASAWSPPATWTMGVLKPADWQAQWIGAADTNIPSLRLRREFEVPRQPNLRRALIAICGLGEYELTINGRKIGDDFLSPGWTKYDKTCLYDTRDITVELKAGQNAIGIELGNGMYNVIGGGRFTKFKGSFGPQKVIAQIRLEFADGRTQFIVTDEHWRVAPGPITFSSIYGGEDCDARLNHAHWNQPGYDASAWAGASALRGPGGVLRGLSCAAPPLKFFETHKPISQHVLTNGDVVYDLGQNAAHVPRITVTGPAGSKVRLSPSELLDSEGALNQSSMGAGHRGTIYCEYTKATDGVETWSPKFFYVGCRYIQVHLTPAVTNGARPRIQSLAGIVVQSASPAVGEFECSNDLFNRTRRLVRWAQRSNMVSLLTDCPHRERLGWLEEDHLNGPALRYEFDLAQLFTKTLNDIADSQLTNGLVPTTAPEYTIFRTASDPNHLRNAFGDSPEWSSSLLLVPWQQYEFAGDLNLFRLHYDTMKAYLDYLGSRAEHGIVNYGLGDWYDVGPKKPGVSQLTPIALTATAFYYEDTKIMSQAAGLLGQTADAQNYSALADKIRAAFNAEFYDATNQWYATDSQCANAMPLVMGLCEPANREAVTEAIVRDVRARGNALTAGDVGYRYLLRALADGGHSEVIFDINDQTNQPGYGLQLAKGKTSLTEAWDGGSSQNHFMLGQIQEWFYHDLAGIQSGGNGFKQIIIAPQPAGDVSWVKAGFDSVRGKITCQWRRAAEKFTLKITIPANTTATVFVPSNPGTHVKNTRTGVQFLRYEKDRAVFAVGSGEYEFQSVY